ncbi:MAG: hypothetical protein ABI874_07440 [Chloroflexota bacterium]
MDPSPLLHGVSGIFDEIILGAEVVLVLALIVAFVRSRRRKPDPPPTTEPMPDQRQ